MVELIIYAFVLTATCFAGLAISGLAYFVWCVASYIRYEARKKRKASRLGTEEAVK